MGSISEINTLAENGDYNWSNVDLDALWEHLKGMDSLMTLTRIRKTEIENGLHIFVSSKEESGVRAMNNMIPAHSKFLSGVRKEWKISYEKKPTGYLIVVQSQSPKEIKQIRALGFSGLMVQDDHHRSHHVGIALGEIVH